METQRDEVIRLLEAQERTCAWLARKLRTSTTNVHRWLFGGISPTNPETWGEMLAALQGSPDSARAYRREEVMRRMDELGLSYGWLARRANVSPQSLNNWIRGISRPSNPDIWDTLLLALSEIRGDENERDGDFASELRRWRISTRMSQQQVADQLSMTRGGYANYEAGTAPVPEHRLALLRTLGFRSERSSGKTSDTRATTSKRVEIEYLTSRVGLLSENQDDYLEQKGSYAWPVEFVLPPPSSTDHCVIRIASRNFSPILKLGDMVLFREDEVPIKDAIVLAKDPSDNFTIKVLAEVGEEWVLRSLDPSRGPVTDMAGWKVRGHAIAIFREKIGMEPNIVWRFGQAIRV